MTAQSLFVPAFAVIAACTVAASVTKAADPVSIQNVKTTSATVESIEADKDLVWLRDADGRSSMIVIPPGVRSSEQIQVGDKLIVRYRESIVASVKPKGSRTTRDDDSQVANTASADQPNVLPGHTISRTVVIQSVNRSTHSIAYKDTDGFSRDATITDPDAQRFIGTLKSGDEVDVTYTDASSVSVEREK